MIRHSDIKAGLEYYFSNNLEYFIASFGGRSKLKELIYQEDKETGELSLKNYLLLFSKDHREYITTFLSNSPNRNFMLACYIDILEHLEEVTENSNFADELYKNIGFNIGILNTTLDSNEKLYLDFDLDFDNKDLAVRVTVILYLIIKYYLKEFINLIEEK